MATITERYLAKRRFRSCNSSDSFNAESPEKKKLKNQNCGDLENVSDDEILTALNMSEDVATSLQQILSKLQKLDTIESAIKSIEVKLQNLETRSQRPESSETTAKQERE